MNKKVRAARLSIFSNTLLIMLKLIAGFLSGSVSILSEAIHSGIDLVASGIAYFAVKVSSKEPDKEHPYGHGKFENISGVVEGLLIFLAAFWIIYEAVFRLIEPAGISYFGLAIGIMIVSAVVNYFVSRRLYKVAEETNSIALEADALHLRTDVYSSLGVGLGLLFIYFTDWYFFDPIFAIIVALFIMKESYQLISSAFIPLMDGGIKNDEYNSIHDKLEMITCKYKTNFDHLRVRKSGPKHFIDFILLVDPMLTVADSHSICDEIEDQLKKDFLESEISIHVEPKV